MDVSIIVILLLAKIENCWNYSVLFFQPVGIFLKQRRSAKMQGRWKLTEKKKWKKKTESSVMNELTKNLIKNPDMISE